MGTGELEVAHVGSDLRYREIDDVQVWHKDHEEMARDAAEWWQHGKGGD